MAGWRRISFQHLPSPPHIQSPFPPPATSYSNSQAALTCQTKYDKQAVWSQRAQEAADWTNQISGRGDRGRMDGGGMYGKKKPTMKTTVAVKQRDSGRHTEAGGRWCNGKTEGGKGGGRDGGWVCRGEQREEGRLCLSLSKEDNEVSGAEPTPAWQIPERTCCPGLALRTALTHITELDTFFFFLLSFSLAVTVWVSRALSTNTEKNWAGGQGWRVDTFTGAGDAGKSSNI